MTRALLWLAAVLTVAVSLPARAQLRIGQPSGFTGSVAAGVKENTEGAKLYLDAINARGGVKGRKVVIRVEDDKGDPKEAATVAQKFASDDKILAVPVDDPMHGEYFDIADLPTHYLREIEHFFAIYKDLEGKRVEVLGWGKSDEAMRIIDESIVRYAEQYLSQGP